MEKFFHLCVFGLYSLLCRSEQEYIQGDLLPFPEIPESKYLWLSFIVLYIMKFYHLAAFISLLFTKKRIFLLDYIFRCIVGPFGLGCSVIYWMHYTVTRGDGKIGTRLTELPILNHGLHTLPAISAHLFLFSARHYNFTDKAFRNGKNTLLILYFLHVFCVLTKADNGTNGEWKYIELLVGFYFVAMCDWILHFSFGWLHSLHTRVYGKKPEEPLFALAPAEPREPRRKVLWKSQAEREGRVKEPPRRSQHFLFPLIRYVYADNGGLLIL